LTQADEKTFASTFRAVLQETLGDAAR